MKKRASSPARLLFYSKFRLQFNSINNWQLRFLFPITFLRVGQKVKQIVYCVIDLQRFNGRSFLTADLIIFFWNLSTSDSNINGN